MKWNPLLNDHFILGLILLNAVLCFFQCFDDSSTLLSYADTVFLLCFIAEIISKVICLTWTKYWSCNWNRFDFIVTLISSVSLIRLICPDSTVGSLEFLMALRVFRVFRFFRLLRFVPAMDSIISGVKRAILSTYVIVFAFLLIGFIWSIISCSLFKEISPEYFGDPITSFGTIFRLFTIEGWYEIPDAVAAHYSYWGATIVKLFFCVLLFCGGIIGMSFINSIIVDSMVSDNNDALQEHVQKLEDKIDRLLQQQGQNQSDSTNDVSPGKNPVENK